MTYLKPNDWLVLVISLPSTSATARMRIWRSLKALGCAALRDGAYLLPAGEVHAAAFATLGQETQQEGGQAWVLAVAAQTTHEIAAFTALFDRSAEHATFCNDLSAARKTLFGQLPVEVNRTLRKFTREFDALSATDFFAGESSLRTQAAWADFLESAQAALSPGEPQAKEGTIPRLDIAAYRGRTWATRSKLWVDRVASAWLIRRFIDPEARFLWLAQTKACPTDALGFDFDGAVFTHVGEKVTFEVLIASFGLEADRGLQGLARMVHALDVGDVSGAPTPEALGFEAILKGASQRLRDDDALLADIGSVLDSLYTHFSQQEPKP